jgi:DNA gyrase subunit B/topoisomerase-4 subunit B
MNFIRQTTKLIDCDPAPLPTGAIRELIVVEGDSASLAVARLRDSRFQAVLPMQGKPMNATKAPAAAVRRNQWFAALVDAMGIGWNQRPIEQSRFQRIVLLFDPDADGIHSAALMLLFFDEVFPEWLAGHRLAQVRPPQFQIRAAEYRDTLQAYSPDHLAQLQKSLRQHGIAHHYQRYRGLASLDDATLHQTCIDPASRTAYLLRPQDAEDARSIFGRPRRAENVSRER